MDSNQIAHTESDGQHDKAAYQVTRAPYVVPLLEHLGRWSALTLQQSVPVGMFSRPEL
jgi:hypothetical protein